MLGEEECAADVDYQRARADQAQCGRIGHAAGAAQLEIRGPHRGERGNQRDPGEPESEPRPRRQAPPEREDDEDIDRRILEEIGAIGEQRDRADPLRSVDLDAEIRQVGDRDNDRHAAQRALAAAVKVGFAHAATAS